MDSVKVITPSIDRWQDVKELRLEALKNDPASFGETYENSLAYPDIKWKERLQAALEGKNSITLYAEVDGHLIGQVGAFDKNGTMGVWGVYVKPEFRGKGYAQLLFGRLFEKLKALGHTKCILTVNSETIPAQKLYEKIGFVKTGENLETGVSHIKKVYFMEKSLL
jgi:ribosomal protein S18 acetylase RimI-like enzyme